MTKTGSGLGFSGSNSYTGNTVVSKGVLESAGTVSLPGWNVPNAISVAGGGVLAVQTSGGATAWNSSQIGTLLTSASWANNTAGLGIDTTNGDFTYGGNITQALTLTKLGSNALSLSGNNTYTGGTTLAAGQLNINSSAALGWGLSAPAAGPSATRPGPTLRSTRPACRPTGTAISPTSVRGTT